MKLNLQQKIAVTLSALWLGPLFFAALFGLFDFSKEAVPIFFAALIPPLFVLWISGALPIVTRWFKESD